MKNIVFLISLILIVGVSSAVEFIPNGDMNLKNTYSIKNVKNFYNISGFNATNGNFSTLNATNWIDDTGTLNVRGNSLFGHNVDIKRNLTIFGGYQAGGVTFTELGNIRAIVNGSLAIIGNITQLDTNIVNITINNSLTVIGNNTNTIPLKIIGANGQIANLTEWQNSTGNTEASISRDGSGRFNNAYVMGNLGVGTSNPSNKLYVAGDGYFTNQVTINTGGIDVTGGATFRGSHKIDNRNGMVIGIGGTGGGVNNFDLTYDSTNDWLDLSDGTNDFLRVKDLGTTARTEVIGNLNVSTGDVIIDNLKVYSAKNTTSGSVGLIGLDDGNAININRDGSTARATNVNIGRKGVFQILNSDYSTTQLSINSTHDFGVGTNINPDTLASSNFVVRSTGNVGIGTTTPSYKLDISGGDINIANNQWLRLAGGAIIGGTTANVQAYVGSTDFKFNANDGSPLVTILAGGNVGINTTSPSDEVHLKGGDQTSYRVESTGNTNARYMMNNTQGSWGIMARGTTGNFDIYDYDMGGEAVSIKSGMGMVGIGTVNPTENLTVNGNFSAKNGNISGSFNLATSGGNVGIGTTSPNSKLSIFGGGSNAEVSGEASYSGDIIIKRGQINGSQSLGGIEFKVDNFSSGYGWKITAADPDQSSNNMPMIISSRYNNKDWTDLVTINRNGSVGIGTTSPNATLNVRGGVNVTGSVNLATLEGNVGIGTTAPETKLDVQGGTILIDNNQGYYAESTTGTNLRLLYLDTSDTWAVGGSGDSGGYLISGSTLYFQPGVATTMAMTSGKVGIGTDISPDYELEIYDATNTPTLALTDDDVLHGVTTLAQTDVLALLTSISTTVGGLQITGLADADGTALGLKGVQSSSPTDTTPAISLIGTKASGTGVQDLDATETILAVANNDNANALVILGGGNVGIGTTVPSAKLQVNGTMIVNGTARINGSLSSEAYYDSLNDGLVLHIPFSDGTGTLVSDKSRYGRDGTTTGSPTWNATGRFGNALNFDGTSDYVEFGSWFNYQNFTISFWANPRDTQLTSGGFGAADIMDNYHNGSTNWVIQQNGTNTNQYSWQGANNTFTLQANTWQHVVLTKTQNGNSSVYLNGVLSSSISNSGSITYEDQFLTIGRWGRGGAREWNGTLDEVRMYDRVLSVDEVRELYGRGLGTQGIYVNVTTGNVGIGTASPGYKIDIQNAAGNALMKLTGDTGSGAGIDMQSLGAAATWRFGPGMGTLSNVVDFSIGTVAAGTQFVIKSDGNVGINTTSPQQTLSVQGSLNVTPAGQSQESLFVTSSGLVGIRVPSSELSQALSISGLMDFRSGGNTIGYIGTGSSGITGGSTTGIGIRSADTLAIATNGNNLRMLIDASGNVGIGTATPSSKLHVNDTFSPTTPSFKVTDTNTGGYFAVQDGYSSASEMIPAFFFNSSGVDGQGGDFIGNIPSANDVQTAGRAAIRITAQKDNTAALTSANVFQISNWETKLVTVDSAGKTGIGAVTPAVKLHVNGTGVVAQTIESTSSYVLTNYKAGAAGDVTWQVGSGWDNVGDFFIVETTKASPQLTIKKTTGRVGLGASNPQDALEVRGNITMQEYSADSPQFRLTTDRNNVSLIATYTGSSYYRNMSFQVGGSERMKIDTSGNVGIGTASPIQTLTVVGDINATKNITADNVFVHRYILSHSNSTIAVAATAQWKNVTFDYEEDLLRKGINHTFNNNTNNTFTIDEDGIYEIYYKMSFQDSNAAPDANIVTRVVKNNVEITGSVHEIDSHKQLADISVSHMMMFKAFKNDKINFQFTSDDTTVSLKNHATYGEKSDSASIYIKKIDN